MKPEIIAPVFIELIEPRGTLYLNVLAVESVYVPDLDTDGQCVITMQSGAVHNTDDESSKLFDLLRDSGHLKYSPPGK